MLLLCSCNDEFTAPDYPVIEYPVNENEAVSQVTSEPITYYANKNSKKFHLPECTYVEKMLDSSVRFEKDKDKLINEGYSPCSKCNP